MLIVVARIVIKNTVNSKELRRITEERCEGLLLAKCVATITQEVFQDFHSKANLRQTYYSWEK